MRLINLYYLTLAYINKAPLESEHAHPLYPPIFRGGALVQYTTLFL